ncbi:MAG: FeoC-like transcriptional regulator [Candidatus Cloacimonetes bacterium]|nr:FeoC-like transcriptional regulator [Candidatus Cloacimonadota bacterium]MCF7815250.1 FeoC-like transcriptional regulator [Candidatus Cloacimonadota bacterium]MCF7868468.1 FeoC-like transcriptional regulator [Candidatus Cloacimonadota bacterium]MCF7883912.1 FeoC-like transcriptional regulator [Candidatus Cloacimonadota bacterium]
MLVSILDLFEERKVISLDDLCKHFDVDPQTMKEMLNKLVIKGKIARKPLECESFCNHCGMCELTNEKFTYKLL